MSKTRFLKYEECAEIFRGKSVAIVGSAPSSMENDGRFIESHDIIVRIQNYKIVDPSKQGSRTDVHFSFYGTSMRKKADELKQDGVYLCMCKLFDGKLPFTTDWHIRNRKNLGVDYRYVFSDRANWWFCDVYAPTQERYMDYFSRIKNADKRYPGHQPTTGFACLLDVMGFDCASVYVTGFDFFTSKKHNVNETWFAKNPDDPIRHRPDLELEYIKKNWPKNWKADRVLSSLIS